MSLYVSMKIPSSDLSETSINDSITLLASRIASVRRLGQLPQEPALDITFMLPGKHEKPDCYGMRMGGYSDADRTLYFETAVPDNMTQSASAPYYVACVMRDVIDNADRFFSESGVSFDAEHWRSLINDIITPESLITGNSAVTS